MNPVLRPAVEQDMNTVFELINELAVYENAGHKVLTCVDDFIRDGFGENPLFGCVVAEVDKKVVGFALYYTRYSTWNGPVLYLEDLLVTKALRGKGIGELLFEEMIRIAQEKGMRDLNWQVLDWNEPAINFYKKYDVELDPEWINGRITVNPV